MYALQCIISLMLYSVFQIRNRIEYNIMLFLSDYSLNISNFIHANVHMYQHFCLFCWKILRTYAQYFMALALFKYQPTYDKVKILFLISY